MKKIRIEERYTDKGRECMAPGCRSTETFPVFPLAVPSGKKTPNGADICTQYEFLYCREHMMRPYEYEFRGELAPEIKNAIHT